MFSYQGGPYLEVFSTQGNAQTCFTLWKLSSQNNIQRVFDKELKDEMLTLDLGISDTQGGRRRVIFSTAVKELKTTPLHMMIPFPIEEKGVWTTFIVPLASMVEKGYPGSIYKSLDSISFHGTFKLRRIFTLKEFNEWDEIPLKLDFNRDLLNKRVIAALPDPKLSIGSQSTIKTNAQTRITSIKSSSSVRPSLNKQSSSATLASSKSSASTVRKQMSSSYTSNKQESLNQQRAVKEQLAKLISENKTDIKKEQESSSAEVPQKQSPQKSQLPKLILKRPELKKKEAESFVSHPQPPASEYNPLKYIQMDQEESNFVENDFPVHHILVNAQTDMLLNQPLPDDRELDLAILKQEKKLEKTRVFRSESTLVAPSRQESENGQSGITTDLSLSKDDCGAQLEMGEEANGESSLANLQDEIDKFLNLRMEEETDSSVNENQQVDDITIKNRSKDMDTVENIQHNNNDEIFHEEYLVHVFDSRQSIRFHKDSEMAETVEEEEAIKQDLTDNEEDAGKPEIVEEHETLKEIYFEEEGKEEENHDRNESMRDNDETEELLQEIEERLENQTVDDSEEQKDGDEQEEEYLDYSSDEGTDPEQSLELEYDALTQCYIDPKTKKRYELNE